jgi:hypothetical protein
MSAERPMTPDRAAEPRLGRLETALVWVLVLLGLGLRVADLPRPFDRQFDGFQGSCFTVFAVNYQRQAEARGEQGFWPAGAGHGYPVFNLELDVDQPQTWVLYANHPPLVPWLSWAGLRLLAPDDWDQRWREELPPRDAEGAIRAPFLALHLLALGLLFATLRAAGAPRAAAYAVAACALLPSALLYAGLPNYEQPSLAAVGIACWSAVGFARSGRRAYLLGVAIGCGLGGAVTFGPAFFAGTLGLIGLAHGWRRAVALGAAAIPAVLLPLLVHGQRAGALLAERGHEPDTLPSRVLNLIEPLLAGTVPAGVWLATQARLATAELGFAALFAAALGTAWSLHTLLRSRDFEQRLPAAVALALLAGGALLQFAFYRHTADPQDPFLINLLPGLAAAIGLGAARLHRRAPALALALLSAVALEGGWRSAELHRRWRGEGPTASAPWPALSERPPIWIGPTPVRLGATLAELVPAGSCLWYPAALGLGPAHSYYAWRTLLPTSPGHYALTQTRQEELGLGAAPTWFVAPDLPPSAAAAEVEALLADFEAARPGSRSEPDRRLDGWAAWRLR